MTTTSAEPPSDGRTRRRDRGRVLVDTAYVQALLNNRDHLHERAKSMFPLVRSMQKYITESVLVELADGLSNINRVGTARFLRMCHEDPTFRVVAVDSALLEEGLGLYESRPDKSWGLTDCISFAVMMRENLTLAPTADRHFVQAGFRALMLEES